MQQPELRLDTNGQRERERLALTSLFVKQGSTTSLGLEGLGKKIGLALTIPGLL